MLAEINPSALSVVTNTVDFTAASNLMTWGPSIRQRDGETGREPADAQVD